MGVSSKRYTCLAFIVCEEVVYFQSFSFSSLSVVSPSLSTVVV